MQSLQESLITNSIQRVISQCSVKLESLSRKLPLTALTLTSTRANKVIMLLVLLQPVTGH